MRRRSTSDLRLCRTCWLPRGHVGEDDIVQRCLCEIKTLRREDQPDEFLSNGSIEDVGFRLCAVCVSAAVDVGSRYALIVSDGCEAVVCELNEAAHACVVPISRHGSVNGRFHRNRRPRKGVAELVDSLRDLGGKFDLMKRWEKALAEEICAEAGLDGADDVALEDYLAAASGRWASSQEPLDTMFASWLADRESIQ